MRAGGVEADCEDFGCVAWGVRLVGWLDRRVVLGKSGGLPDSSMTGAGSAPVRETCEFPCLQLVFPLIMPALAPSMLFLIVVWK